MSIAPRTTVDIPSIDVDPYRATLSPRDRARWDEAAKMNAADLFLRVEYRVLRTTSRVAEAAFAAFDESVHRQQFYGWRDQRQKDTHEALNRAAADAYFALRRFEREHGDVVKAESEAAR